MSDSWVDDVTGSSESESSTTGSLFADNFRGLVEDGEVDSLNPQTIEEQIDDIEDKDLLAEAIEVDDREEVTDVYQERLSELNQEDAESQDPEGGEPEETEDAPDGDAVEGEEDIGEVVSEADEAEEKASQEVAAAAGEKAAEDDSEDETTEDTEPVEESQEDTPEPASGTSELDVDVSSIAPDAVTREDAASEDNARSVLVWGQEGVGKTHFAHSAPGPIAYIDTEGKADEIADKFDKNVWYFQPGNYREAKDALDQAFDLLREVKSQHDIRGTIVVDSITKMWFWAKQDYQELAFPSADGPEEVDFKSALQGEDDWSQIKRRHNTNFRQPIIESPYHVVFTASAKEDYNAVIQGANGKPMTPDGEKDNPYVVKEVIRLRANDEGITVADLHKSAKTRRSFKGLEWPEWDDAYDAIDRIAEAEKSNETVDVSTWPFDVLDGKPTYIDNDTEDNDD